MDPAFKYIGIWFVAYGNKKSCNIQRGLLVGLIIYNGNTSNTLPVANYLSTISVAADGAGSKITWIGKYDAKGASDAEAMKVIDGVYQGGIDALVK